MVNEFYADDDAEIQQLKERSTAKASEMQKLIADATEGLEDEIKAETAKEKIQTLTEEVMKKYDYLCEHPDEVRELVIHRKWLPAIRTRLLNLL